MRAIALVILLAGCGRFGFDSSDETDDIPSDDDIADAPSDTTDGVEPDASLPDGRWRAVSTSAISACGITLTGELWCWGANDDGRLIGSGDGIAPPTRIGSDSDWTAVATGGDYTCGLRGAGDLYCWGFNYYGAVGTGALDELFLAPTRITAAQYASLATANYSTCAVQSDRKLMCWGRNQAGQLGLGSLTLAEPPQAVGANVRTVAIGANHICTTNASGELYCAGANWLGQLGTGDGMDHPTFALVGNGYAQVIAGDEHTCALRADGASECWGVGERGRLGTGTGDWSATPRATAAPPLTSLAAGLGHTCGATSTGELWCWGQAVRGAIPGQSAETLAPTRITAPPTTAVAAAGFSTCIVDDDAHILCSGNNAYGQAGQLPEPGTLFTQADTRTDWASISAQSDHGCATTTSNQTFCWGSNADGQLGDGSYLDRQDPVPVQAGTSKLSGLELGSWSSYGVDGTTMFGWGWTPLFDMTLTSPVIVSNTAVSVASGFEHACWVEAGGELHCMGDNKHQELGRDDIGFSTDEVIPGTWIDAYAGRYVSCGTRTDGSVNPRLYCWGITGLLGTLTTSDQFTPVRAELPDLPINTVAFGVQFGCAIINGGELWCWGAGWDGRLGQGTFDDSDVPVRVGVRSDWVDVDLGDDHACAIAADRTLWCWGKVLDGEGGAMTVALQPQAVGGTNWADVACGDSATCALKTDGTRWCGGANEDGELGNGEAWLGSLSAVP